VIGSRIKAAGAGVVPVPAVPQPMTGDVQKIAGKQDV